MADYLKIQNGKATATTDEGRTFERDESLLFDMIRQEILPPVDGLAFPDGIKFMEFRDPVLLVVHQQSAHVRQLRWIKEDSPRQYGPGTTYRKVRLSLPYAITFAAFIRHGNNLCLSGSNELYFRNELLLTKKDPVCFPAVLNISYIKAPKRIRAWICTQHLRHPPGADWTRQLNGLLDHTWNGAFNLSSEAHEGASWYGKSKGAHPDLHPVEKWEKASAKDDAFYRQVRWQPSPLNVGELMECMFEEHLAAAGRQRPNLIGRFVNYAQKK